MGQLAHQEQDPDVRVDILVQHDGTTKRIVDWPKKETRNPDKNEYTSDEFKTLGYGVESVCSTLTDDKSNHRIVAAKADYIMRCVLEVYVDGTHSKLNIIEYYGDLSEAQITLGMDSLNETANFCKEIIFNNDKSSFGDDLM